MIELKVTGVCEGCPAIDLEFEKVYSDEEVSAVLVACRNGEMCYHLEKHISNGIRAADLPNLEVDK